VPGTFFKGKGIADMDFLEFRVILQYFRYGHAGGQPSEYIAHGNAGPLDTGFSKTDFTVYGDIEA
jgi:hypothetical protein